jgi:signal transduction histidine kinase
MHQIQIESILSIFILGVTLMALLYHLILYLFNKDQLLKYYIIYLTSTTIFIFIYSDALPICFGQKNAAFIFEHFREGFQILYLCLYFNFILQSIEVSRSQNSFLFRSWKIITTVLLTYALTVPILKLTNVSETVTSILFVVIRVFIFGLTFAMLWKCFQLRHLSFQRFILIGCSIFFVCGLLSFSIALANPNQQTGISPIEWLFIGNFFDIVLFSAAMGFRIKQNMQDYHRALLQETENKLALQTALLQKQQAVELERNRIAADMHDDLGSGLTKITYVSQMAMSRDNSKDALAQIHQSSKQLVENMREIIWAMKEENNTIQDLVHYIKTYAVEYCADNQLHCTVTFPNNLYERIVKGANRRNIYLAIKEVLHNIVKHAQAKNVHISASFEKEWKVCIVDDGVGIDLGKLKQAGRGNGLQNIRKRIEAVGGTVEMANHNGTIVTFNIPL